jgi:hypothetical protein
MRAWRVSGWNSLATQNGFLVFDIDIEDMSIQLYRTSFSRTLIPLCRKSSKGGEKQNNSLKKS